MRKLLSGAVTPVQGEKDANNQYVPPPPPSSPPPFILGDLLFDKQLKFVEDPHAFKIAVCSRRAGKTVACAADLIRTALETPNVICLYITLSRSNAKKLVWRELKKLKREYSLYADEDQTELSMTFPNGSVIYCSGAKDASEIEKFRGLAIKLCYIDECQSFREYIRDLIDEVISPALLDWAGTLCLIGTPGALPIGYFAECAGAVRGKEEASKSWTLHSWTFFDNPFIPAVKLGKYTHRQLLERELHRRGVDASDPTIQREWFGKWEHDSKSLLINYDAEKNHYPVLPTGIKWNYIMGIDLGFNDADAIAILAWSEATPVTYLVEESLTRKQGLTELVEQVQQMQRKYDCSKLVIDEGGLGKKLAEEMRRRHQLPVQAADKVRKMENVAFLNDAMRTKRFMAKSASAFAQDCFLVEIDKDKSRPDKIKVSEKYHSDIIDAVLYAFKESPAYAYQAAEKEVAYGSPAWARKQQDSMFEAAQEHFKQQQEIQERIENFGMIPENYKPYGEDH